QLGVFVFSLSKPPHLRSSLIHGHHLKQHATSESYERKCYKYDERTITFTIIEDRHGEPYYEIQSKEGSERPNPC
ncbi:MAG: hypothetical protein O7C65_00160, partial [Planctomycetota bacterium]|nr:hypothetical protein [Planctomycetota bacterium]